MKNICLEYAKRIGNEVGWLTQLIERGNKDMMTSANPIYFHEMFSLNTQAVWALYKMQIVYLVNLFDSFMQDYIGDRDNLTESEMNAKNFWKNYVKAHISSWEAYYKIKNAPINNSTSFMNIRFSLFVLKERYNINYPSYLSPAIPELGSLRNCLVHYDGDLMRTDKGGHPFRETLNETLIILQIDKKGNRLMNLNINDLINKVTFDLQIFVDLCGGLIRKPEEHRREFNK